MKFTWDSWDFDCDGNAYIIAKKECPEKECVPNYIIKSDNLNEECKEGMVVEEGWCKYQVRSDWINTEKPCGGYLVETYEPHTRHSITNNKKRGWFPVWIVRKGEWYYRNINRKRG